MLSEHSEKKALRSVIREVYIDIQKGNTLSYAMGRHKIFPRVYINMIKAGESGGILEVVIKRLVSFLETSMSFKEEIISALIYPILAFRRRRPGCGCIDALCCAEFFQDIRGHGTDAAPADPYADKGQRPLFLVLVGDCRGNCPRDIHGPRIRENSRGEELYRQSEIEDPGPE